MERIEQQQHQLLHFHGHRSLQPGANPRWRPLCKHKQQSNVRSPRHDQQLGASLGGRWSSRLWKHCSDRRIGCRTDNRWLARRIFEPHRPPHYPMRLRFNRRALEVLRKTARAFTRWDLLICLATVAMLAVWIPTLTRPKPRSNRINCLSNLKQIGLGFRMWSNDHWERFPWQVPTNEGGTLEYANSREVFRHFQAASNELNSPKILACSEDKARLRTTVFDFLSNQSLSYFVEIETNRDQVYLAGDRFLSTNKSVLSGLVTISSAKSLRWVRGGHEKYGNMVFADGSATQVPNGQLGTIFTNLPVRLAIP
jgi:prepilin-type processing-associated H-X9-DG protein